MRLNIGAMLQYAGGAVNVWRIDGRGSMRADWKRSRPMINVRELAFILLDRMGRQQSMSNRV